MFAELRLFLLGFIWLTCGSLQAAPLIIDTQADEDWLNDDSEERAAQINEGSLVFLTSPIDTTVLHSENLFTIKENSLQTGWVELKQCYRNLDVIARVEIVYNYRQMRDLKVVHHQGIGKAKVVDQSVQLEDVSEQASVCVQAEVRVFYLNPDGRYSLVNGPYMRKFLDGYYPYYVSFEIHFPGQLLSFEDTLPPAQKGFDVRRSKDRLEISAWFEGKLNTEIRFRPRSRL